MRYEAILFDVDGTLIHSAPGIYHTFAETFRSLGVDPDEIDLSRYLGPPLRWSFARHFTDPAMVEQAVATFRKIYAAKGCHECSLFPGVKEMLVQLRDAGVFLATATSKETHVAAGVLRETDILSYFDLVGGSSLDASVDTKTAVIEQDLKDARLTGKRVLMVGDRQDDLKGAADCHLPAAAVLYGYGGLGELTPWKPVFMAPDCQALTDYILG